MLEMINTQFVNIMHTQNNIYWAIIFHSSQSALLKQQCFILALCF